MTPLDEPGIGDEAALAQYAATFFGFDSPEPTEPTSQPAARPDPHGGVREGVGDESAVADAWLARYFPSARGRGGPAR